MTARVIQDGHRLFIEADLSDFHAAGLFLAFRGALTQVRMGHHDRNQAQRLVSHINQASRAKAGAEARRAQARHQERIGR